MKIGRVHLSVSEQEDHFKIRNCRTIFCFTSGTRIEVSYHFGRHCWMAQRETPDDHSTCYGFGGTRLQAVKNLRNNLAMRVMERIAPQEPKVYIDEFRMLPDEIWETFKK